MILLDGMDEAPDRVQRNRPLQLAENLSRVYPQCRLVVTSRPPAYTGNTVLPQFEHVEIAALSQDAIEKILDHLNQDLHTTAPTQADEHRRILLEVLHERPEIRRIARNAAMLTALAVVHWNEGYPPELHADLYESVIRWLARSREQRPGCPQSELRVLLLRELALAMQNLPQGRQTQVPKRWTAEQLPSYFARTSAEKPGKADVTAAEEFLTDEELDSGIIPQLGQDLRFWHLQFQEYFAATAIAGSQFLQARYWWGLRRPIPSNPTTTKARCMKSRWLSSRFPRTPSRPKSICGSLRTTAISKWSIGRPEASVSSPNQRVVQTRWSISIV